MENKVKLLETSNSELEKEMDDTLLKLKDSARKG